MSEKTLNRREFLKGAAIAALGIAAASCAQPTPQVIEKEVPVEKIVKETVIVEKQVPVEKVVKETVVVEKQVVIEKVVTATPPAKFKEAPMLAELVKAGKLPPVEERLPQDPAVVKPVEEIGQYGGTWRYVFQGVGDLGGSLARMVQCDGLVVMGTDGASVVPDLISKWDIADNASTYTFFLRKGVKWSDGAPLTADDFVYIQEDVYLNTELSPSYPSMYKVKGEPMKLEKLDAYSFRLKFAGPYALLPVFMATNPGTLITPAHYLKQFHAKYVKKEDLDKMVKDAKLERWDQLYGQKNAARDNVELPTINPWKYVQGPPETTIIHERNPYYWKVDPEGNQLPYIDRVRGTSVENAEILNLKALGGEVDMQLRNIAFSKYALYKENEKKGDYRLFLWQEGQSGICVFPCQTVVNDEVLRKLMQDIRFRTALAMAIDRDEVNELVYNGVAPDLSTLLPPKYKNDKTIFAAQVYDPKKAEALLDELGCKKGSGQWRTRPDGKELALTIEGLVSFAEVQSVCELIARYWQQIGINAAFKVVTYDQWWDRVYTAEPQVLGYLLENMDPIIQATYHRNYACSQRDCYWATLWGYWYQTEGKSGEEPTGYAREVQKMFDALKLETDQAKIADMMSDIMRIVFSNVSIIFTVGRAPRPVVVKNNFRNVPEKGIDSWQLRSPGYTRPEQYFFKS